MPIRSKAQWVELHQKHPKVFKQFQQEAPVQFKDLPDYVPSSRSPRRFLKRVGRSLRLARPLRRLQRGGLVRQASQPRPLLSYHRALVPYLRSLRGPRAWANK